MQHPYQVLIADKSGEHLFLSAKNHLYVFRVSDGEIVGSWLDPVDSESKRGQKIKSKEDEADGQAPKRAKMEKKPKIVMSDTFIAPHNYIRSLTLTRNGRFLVATTDSDKAAVIFKLNFTNDNCLDVVKRQMFPKRPCAVSMSIDDKQIVVADKFGDVYSIPLDDSAPVDEKALVPILGHVSMLSDVLVAEHDSHQFVLTGDRDEHIKITHFPMSYVVKHWLFGHREFVSTMHICSFDPSVLISGGGDDYLLFWNWYENKQLAQVELRDLVLPHLTDAHFPPERFLQDNSQKEISITQVTTLTRNGVNLMFVLCENTNCLLTFTVTADFEVTLKQKLVGEHPFVGFAVCGSSVFFTLDVDGGDLVEAYEFNDCVLEKKETDVVKKITAGNKCEVPARSDFFPLYYIHTLRKRSEH